VYPTFGESGVENMAEGALDASHVLNIVSGRLGRRMASGATRAMELDMKVAIWFAGE
jgi:hypothetical protein